MKKNILFLFIGLLAFTASFAQTKWEVDPAHTNVVFNVNHLGISFVNGEFTKLEGNVETTDAENFDNAKIEFTIDVNSINTRVDARDEHLKSDDFFDAEKYPEITFKNGVLKKKDGNNFSLEGDLTLKDVTEKVSFDIVQNNGVITDPWDQTRAGFTGKIKINRMDYNINYDSVLPSGVDEVGKDIEITVNVEIVKK